MHLPKVPEVDRILLFVLGIVFVMFPFLSFLDWGIQGWRTSTTYNFLFFNNVPQYWVAMWGIGMPAFALMVTAAYKISENSSNFVAFGLFMTVILLWWGQLEDFFYFAIWQGGQFPSGSWTWFQGTTLYWKIFDTWNTALHFRCLALFLMITGVMWYLILRQISGD
jgi:hypothetical protein